MAASHQKFDAEAIEKLTVTADPDFLTHLIPATRSLMGGLPFFKCPPHSSCGVAGNFNMVWGRSDISNEI